MGFETPESSVQLGSVGECQHTQGWGLVAEGWGLRAAGWGAGAGGSGPGAVGRGPRVLGPGGGRVDAVCSRL